MSRPVPQVNRRRALLLFALSAEALAAVAVLRRSPVGSTEIPAPPPAPSVAAVPASLVVGDGRTVHLLGLGGTNTDGLLRRIAREIDAAVDAVVAFWGTDWQRDVIVVATDSDDQFRQFTRGPTGTQWVDVAAAAVADSVDPVRRIATGQRIVFAPGAAAMSDYALRIVLRHELFHFASRADTALDAPRWLTEGVADFVGRPATPRPGSGQAATLAALPSDADFDSAGPELSLAYDRAWWFMRFVADTFGVATVRNLYLRAGGVGHPEPGVAIRDILHADEAALMVRMKLWLAG